MPSSPPTAAALVLVSALWAACPAPAGAQGPDRRLEAIASWVGAEPIEVGVHEFLDEDMPRLRADGYAIAAFPITPGRAAVVTAAEFEANLRHERSQIE